MSILLAALLLGSAAPPPDPDDDAAERKRPKTAIRHHDEDEDEAKPEPRTTAAKQRDGDDDKPKTAGRPTVGDEVSRAPSEPQEQAGDEDDEEGEQPSTPIMVTARRLDTARTQIDAALGSTVYSLTNETVENRPGGETGKLADVLAQAPGVTLSGTSLNVRGSPANQVRINNVIIPEAISDPADHLSSRLAETTRLITGTLPAQFGFAPAGVISVTTKNGLYQHGGQAELFAGTDGTIEPALEWAGSVAGTSLFASGSFEHDGSDIADAAGVSARDRRNDVEGLGFADHVINQSNRVSLILGGSRERHRFRLTSIGTGTSESSDGFAVATFQHSQDGLTFQSSVFGGSASDEMRFESLSEERRRAFGMQIDTSQELGGAHILRLGLLASRSTVREREQDGGRSAASRTATAIYAQDEWKVTPSITLDPGMRLEWLRGFGSLATVEPRATVVWASRNGTTAHIGYARYSAASPLDEEAHGARLPDERDDLLDAGAQQRLGHLTVGVDAYRRSARNYIAEHETLGSAQQRAFEFRRARINGVEISATYARGPLTAWANLAFSRAKAKTVVGGGTLFAPEALVAATGSYVPLASDRPVAASGGLTWRLGKLTVSGDALASSGTVRTLSTDRPGGERYRGSAELGFAAVYHVRIAAQPADLRLDLTNLTNVRYATNDDSSLKGGWTRFARGRALTIGMEQGF